MTAIYHYGEYVGRQPNLGNCREIRQEGSGRLGHYTEQGYRTVYEFVHRKGAITEFSAGSGWWPSSTGSGYDWGEGMGYAPSPRCECYGCNLHREFLRNFRQYKKEMGLEDYE